MLLVWSAWISPWASKDRSVAALALGAAIVGPSWQIPSGAPKFNKLATSIPSQD